MNFSEKLFTLRKANNLTQEHLAEKLDVSRQSVSKWESGQATPELDKIIALSAVFNVSTDDGLAVYLLFFAFYFIGHFHFWDQVSNPSLFFAGLLISTAIVILICVKKLNNKQS